LHPQHGGPPPLVYAHRGDAAHAPENTMAAAIEAGADGIEFDVHATSDGHLVVVHDYELARTTSGEGLVHERTLDEVRSLSAGAWFSTSFADERVPLLDEVLSLDAVGFEIELKGLPTRSLVASLARAVTERGIAQRVKFTSFHLVALAQLHEAVPEASIGLFSPEHREWMSDALYEQVIAATAIGAGFDVVHVPLRHLGRVDVDRLHALGLLVQTALPEGSDEAPSAARRGVDVICTDDPVSAIRSLRG
jgi:glycerophosphoryl diester phosphodiesterase